MQSQPPETAPPEAVVFDIGNVLFHWDPGPLFEELLPGAEDRARFRTEAGFAEMNRDIDAGAPFLARVRTQMAACPDFADVLIAFHDRWLDTFGPPIAGSWSILHALRAAGRPVFALSNFGTETFQRAEAAYPDLYAFDRRFISGPMGCIKPDPEIYERLETETGLAGPALFFTDDSPANIAAAEARGWQTHLFTGPEGLYTALSAAGLPEAELGPRP